MGRLEELERIYAADPLDSLTCFLLGREYLGAKRFGDAARLLAECVAIQPDYTAAWKQLADALRFDGRNEEALVAYRRGSEVAEQTGDLQVKKECDVFIQRLTRT